MDNCGYPMWMVLLAVFIASALAPYVVGLVIADWEDLQRRKALSQMEAAVEQRVREVLGEMPPPPPPPKSPIPPKTRDLPR